MAFEWNVKNRQLSCNINHAIAFERYTRESPVPPESYDINRMASRNRKIDFMVFIVALITGYTLFKYWFIKERRKALWN